MGRVYMRKALGPLFLLTYQDLPAPSATMCAPEAVSGGQRGVYQPPLH